MNNALEKHGNIKKPHRGPGNPNWKPGQSGNPLGRPKGEACITSIEKQLLPLPCPYDHHDPPWTWAEVLAEGELRQAIKLPQAMHNLRGRLEGGVGGLNLGGLTEILLTVRYADKKEAGDATEEVGDATK